VNAWTEEELREAFVELEAKIRVRECAKQGHRPIETTCMDDLVPNFICGICGAKL